MFGLAACDDGGPGFVNASVRTITNARQVLVRLPSKCTGTHRHARVNADNPTEKGEQTGVMGSPGRSSNGGTVERGSAGVGDACKEKKGEARDSATCKTRWAVSFIMTSRSCSACGTCEGRTSALQHEERCLSIATVPLAAEWSAGVIMRGRHCLKVWTKKQQVVALSWAESEQYAAVKTAAEGLGIQSVARDLGITCRLDLHLNASATLRLVNRRGLGKAKHVDMQSLWIQEASKSDRFATKKNWHECETCRPDNETADKTKD